MAIVPVVVAVAHALGLLSAVHALMGTRTSQGAIAWIVSLVSFPWIAVPAYWVFGRSKFNGYVFLRRLNRPAVQKQAAEIAQTIAPFAETIESGRPGAAILKLASGLPYLKGNRVELLINGQKTFDSIIAGIRAARRSVLVQFYIVRDDELGRRLKDALIEKAKEGVPVYFLYDEIGSRGLERYTAELRAAKVRAHPFHTTQGSGNRFQLNFRNHRKIVVTDGEVGWVGGHNVGNEYLGHDKKLPNWRDTHVRIDGPAALSLQLSFLEDWYWATGEQIEVAWQAKRAEGGNAHVLILPSGPADDLETCGLMYQQAIHAAKKRIWIASPYFVPDEGTIAALSLAVLRGADVRILIPDIPDHKLVYYSAFAFLGPLLNQGMHVYRYLPGFIHEKVFLVDNTLSGVGTANLDNRSFRLNFEVTALIHDEAFAREMEAMFEADFAVSRRMTATEITEKPKWFALCSRAAYLAAPIQ